MPSLTSVPPMLCCCVVRPDYIMLVKAASVPKDTIWWHRCLPASCNGLTETELSKQLVLSKTVCGTIAIEGQQFGQTTKWDAEKFISIMNTAVTGTWAGGEQSSFTYCQSFCTAPLGWSAQSGRPLSSWLQIHFGFCLQSSPPSHWCSRCSLADRFAGAPLKWENT